MQTLRNDLEKIYDEFEAQLFACALGDTLPNGAKADVPQGFALQFYAHGRFESASA